MMLIVIPFCHKDEALALKNLEVCRRLGGMVDYICVLSYDRDTNAWMVEAAAKECFREVRHCVYETWHGEQNWPVVQNWAWQSTARHIHEHYKEAAWFWWEADATPLRAGWINDLEKEYRKGGRPFMGHIVPQMGHMNGVAIYPWDVCNYTTSALLTRSAPWDMAMKDETIHQTHRANHLIAHFPRYNGIRISFTDAKALKMLQKRGLGIFHGCNDGTLAKLVLGEKPKASSGLYVRHYTVEDIDRELDESEPMWQREAVRLKELGYECLDYKECGKRVKSFLKQTKWETGQFALSLSENVCHFNCGLVRDGQNTLWLLIRRWNRRYERNWQSTMVACRLNERLEIVSQRDLMLPGPEAEQNEDPRVVFRDGKFWVSHCAWLRGRMYSAKQIFSSFDSGWQYERSMQIRYGQNGLGAPGTEKNWIWFHQDGAWYFVYSFHPHTVVRIENGVPVAEYKTQLRSAECGVRNKGTCSNDIPQSVIRIPQWKYGEIRGGTPPVRVGDEYISFFHSSLPWKGRQKRYYMGAYMFAAKPPFGVIRMTREPLLMGSEEDTRLLGGPLVIFPCGAVLEKEGWLVTFGVNDEACGWVRIPQRDLEERMV